MKKKSTDKKKTIELTNDELKVRVKELRQKIVSARLEKSTRRNKNVRAEFNFRKELARLLTRLNQKEVENKPKSLKIKKRRSK